MLSTSAVALPQQEPGSIRGRVYDADFDAPLPGAQVLIVETDERVTTADEGNYVFGSMTPGTYTLVFSKESYVRRVVSDVVVGSGRLSEVDARLSGEFVDMEEFIVQDVLQLGGSSEAALLDLRFESPSLMDSISADLMSRAGASDAASALRLVPGATVADGKSAVIRGLPDRYVSSQLNGVRVPTADEDKRAVELDQFPAAVIDSIRVSKTFTPDQQGDASGGAVDVRLEGIPDENRIQLKAGTSYNTQVTGRDDFLTYEGGGVGFLGLDDGGRDQQLGSLGGNWEGAAGTTRDDAPVDSKWALSFSKTGVLDNGARVGGFVSLYYERDSSFYDDGTNDSLWVTVSDPDQLVPETIQGAVGSDFKTALFDITKGEQSVQWGGLATFGLETERNALSLTTLYTHIAEDKATLAVDTRGKEYFFPGYDPDDPNSDGNQNRGVAPYIRTETLEYTERTTGTMQLHGEHRLPYEGFAVGEVLSFLEPELDWTASRSFADLDQPDKRQFGELWLAESFHPLFGPIPQVHQPYKPGANFNFGNFQRIWKTIEEDSRQFAVDLKLPFEREEDVEGYLKLGWFDDSVDRKFDQDTFSNFGDSADGPSTPFDDFWSETFPNEDHPILESLMDIDYDGELGVSAVYGMVDFPIVSSLHLVGGARYEHTAIGIVNDPESQAVWYPPGTISQTQIQPGDTDVDFSQYDVLPSIGLVYEPVEGVTLRASYSETVAKQTFKELTPIIQQEFVGGPVFIGNPALEMSALKNYDLRVDWEPYEGALLSASYFDKEVDKPIEYVQRLTDFTFTTPVNYPSGELSGFEFEVRQRLGEISEVLDGVALGANATFIESEVQLTQDEIDDFMGFDPGLTSRDMTNAPDHLYNLYVTYEMPNIDSQIAVFYTVEGDRLVAGAGSALGNFVPNVYEKEYGTLNASFSRRFGEHLKLDLQAKNLTNPTIEEVYRSSFTDEARRSSYSKGVEFSVSLSVLY